MINSKFTPKVFCILYSVFYVLLLAGCRIYGVSESMPVCSYQNPLKDLTTIGRVAIVEMDNDSGSPAVSADVTEAIFLALQKKQVFSLIVVHKDDPAWRSLGIEPDAVHSLEQLSAIRESLKCNAVVVGAVTQYEPYPHMAIGLRIRLLDLSNGQLIWAVEQVWDSSDKTTKSRIKNYFQSQIPSGVESLREQMTIVSPLEFIRFVAFEVAETLKPNK